MEKRKRSFLLATYTTFRTVWSAVKVDVSRCVPRDSREGSAGAKKIFNDYNKQLWAAGKKRDRNNNNDEIDRT